MTFTQRELTLMAVAMLAGVAGTLLVAQPRETYETCMRDQSHKAPEPTVAWVLARQVCDKRFPDAAR